MFSSINSFGVSGIGGYGVEVEVSSLFGDRVRVCTPASVARGQ